MNHNIPMGSNSTTNSITNACVPTFASHKADHSHSILVGQLDAYKKLKPSKLDENIWKLKEMGPEVFNEMNSKYYTAHIEAMARIADHKRLKELKKVYHFSLISIPGSDNLFKGYTCTIKSIDVWFFPCDIVLFSIEIYDSGNTLDSITQMHRQWKDWSNNYDNFHTDELDNLLMPLANLTTSKAIKNLTFQHTKIRQYQVIQVNGNTLDDHLLYELGTTSKIGTIDNPDVHESFKPANDYLDSILKNNTVSAFSNWKALALNDTFTVLANDNAFAEFEPDYNYFEMLYLRCLVQEYYCFSRNNAYREGKKMSIKNADAEIDLMVKYYFYDDMSYDFLPPLMYGAMVKGLGLEGDRHELIGRVKQDLREQRSSRNDRAVAIVKIFAMLTVVSALGEMIKRAFDCLDKIPWFDKAVLASAVLLTVLFLWLTSRRRRK